MVERPQVEIGIFEQMPGLAAGRGAGIEHAHAILYIEQRRGQLGSSVLYRYQAVGKARYLGHWHGFVQPYCIRTDLTSAYAITGQQMQIIRHRTAPAVHAQAQRWRGIAGVKNGLPLIGISAFDAVRSEER